MIILMPPVSLIFSTAPEYLNFSSSIIPHRLHSQYRNAVAAPPLPQPNPTFPKYDTITAAVLWPL